MGSEAVDLGRLLHGSVVMKPYCTTLLIADHVYQDGMTGKWYVLGTHNAIVIDKFPASNVQLGVYFSLTGGQGKHAVKMRLVSDEDSLAHDGEEVCSISTELIFPNPLFHFDYGGDLQIESIPSPGSYFAELWVDDDMAMSKQIVFSSHIAKGPR